MQYKLKDQHDKPVTFRAGLARIEADTKALSCENSLGIYADDCADALCYIATFGNGSDFEIDVVNEHGVQNVYSASEVDEAIKDFLVLASCYEF